MTSISSITTYIIYTTYTTSTIYTTYITFTIYTIYTTYHLHHIYYLYHEQEGRGTPSSKQLKNMTKLFNKELAGFALKKQLKEAKKKLKAAMRKGMVPDVSV